MQMPDEQQPDEAGLNAPPKLVAALKRSQAQPIFIPRAVDDRVLRAAEQHFHMPAPPRFNWLRLIRWGTAAAAIAILALLAGQILRRPPATPLTESSVPREDINHDGRVDILDAFALARRLQHEERPGPALDINGDGIVDERDVTALAAKAVELPKGGPS